LLRKKHQTHLRTQGITEMLIYVNKSNKFPTAESDMSKHSYIWRAFKI
jgi:hypothetical protein